MPRSILDMFAVAPLTGSVDWNVDLVPVGIEREVAPLTGSVDWNEKILQDAGYSTAGAPPPRGGGGKMLFN